VPVSVDLLPALAAYLPQPLVQLLRSDPHGDWSRFARSQPAAVLFADLVGFTPMTEALGARGREGAEELTRILDRVFTALIATCEDYGGVVGKFVGDALTVYWSVERDGDLPEAIQLALTCGLTLQAQMQVFERVSAPAGSFPLAMRIGVAAGMIELRVAGDPSVGLEALVLGQPLLGASKAQAAAQPGEVLAHASAATYAIGPARNGMVVVERPVRRPARRPLQPLTWDGVTNADDLAALMARFLPGALAERILLGQGAFAADLRRVASVFVGLEGVGIDIASVIAAVQHVVSAAGGRVNRVSMGDKGTMIHLLFGAPVANEDDAARAVWATRLLWAELTGRYHIDSLRMGVASGGVYAGPVGGPTRREYTVMGDAVNLSARLMQVAQPGQTVCDTPTVEDASSSFVWQRLPPVMVKGKSQPVEAWLVSETEGFARAAPRQGPLLGREVELTRLKGVLERARRGQSQLVSLSGEGGIGKSRLLQDWVQEAFMDGWWVVMGQAVVTGHESPYLPWRALAAEMLACPPDADIERLTEAARDALEALAPGQVERWPLLGDLLGTPLPDTPQTERMEAPQRRQALMELIALWVKAQSAQTPLFIVLEDAQWADEASIELTLEMAGIAVGLTPQNSKGMVIALVHRPLLTPPSGGWQALQGMVTEYLSLAELSPHAACQLAAHRLGVSSLPSRLTDLLVSRTQGHPFFVEELCQTLQEQGWVRVLDGQVYLSPTLSPAVVPTSVEDLVQSRIDHLGEWTRLTLKVASVLGTLVPFDALLDSYPLVMDALALRQYLSTLERLELLLVETDNPPTYRFKHSITQQVAYRSLLTTQRRDLHGRAARHFEQRLGETPGGAIDTLAYHYSRSAYQTEAVHYLRLAGEQATRQAAYTTAVDYFSQALERVSQTDYLSRCAILEAREGIWRALGDLTARQADLEAFEAAVWAWGDAHWQARAAFRRAVFAYDQGDYHAADALLQRVIGQASVLSDSRLMGLAFLERGNILSGWSRYEDALICYEVAADMFDQQDTVNYQAEAVRKRAEMQRHTGDWVGALVSYEQAESLSEEAGDLAGVAMQRVDQAVLYMQLGMLEEAERDLVAAWQWAEQVNHRYILMTSGAALGELYWNWNKNEDAWPYLLIAHALSEEQDNPSHRVQILLVSAALLLDDDQSDKALEWAREARKLAGHIESAEGEVRAMALEIDALARQNPVAAAHGAWAVLDWLEKADETLRSLPSLYLALGRAFMAADNQGMARTMASQARRLVAAQSGRVQPDSLRDSFLRNSRINREIQAIGKELG
jgi:class 3 adenylate cyclase/tetratricopeptide (TPR) repeat protein